jgi:hypothetical protein
MKNKYNLLIFRILCFFLKSKLIFSFFFEKNLRKNYKEKENPFAKVKT